MKRPLVLFDDTCGLCNWIVRWILARDRHGVLSFATLQGPIGQQLVGGETTSIIYVPALSQGREPSRASQPGQAARQSREEERALFKSDAVVAVVGHLPRPWRWLRLFRVVPRPIRDWLYTVVARLRYALFGEYRPRPLNNPRWAERFIDGSRK
ncbi:MAG: DCC1-like thiol-disulfide oxidoreductase family protein [Opitutaceae bacterium]|nr:DCC1-like thiol-disulfide oxidoreductase family protein [Opitutaceae bacterium]